MPVLAKIKQWFRPARVETATALEEFLRSRAAFLIQKSITEYSQARANMLYSTLMREKGFQAAYEHARWFAYPAGFAMTAEMAMGHLRQAGGAAEDLAFALGGLGRIVFEGFPQPDGAPAAFWSDAAGALDHDLALAALAPPRPVHLIPAARAVEVFDVLPVHSSIRGHDAEMFGNTLKLHLTEISDGFLAAVDARALLAALPRRPRSA